MKIFIDTANLEDIRIAVTRGFIRGITTNPSLMSKEPKANYLDHIGRIVDLIERYADRPMPLSVEVFSKDAVEIERQAKEINTFVARRSLGYRHLGCNRDTELRTKLSVKIQIGWDELFAINTLSSNGISINCTCCMSVTQAVMAAAAGAKYVSLFVGRIRDARSDPPSGKFVEEAKKAYASGALEWNDTDPFEVIRATRKILDQSYPGVEIIAGSIRSVTDIKNAALAGAHIVTVPPKFFPQMIQHFKTDEVVNQFLTDFQNWMN